MPGGVISTTKMISVSNLQCRIAKRITHEIKNPVLSMESVGGLDTLINSITYSCCSNGGAFGSHDH